MEPESLVVQNQIKCELTGRSNDAGAEHRQLHSLPTGAHSNHYSVSVLQLCDVCTADVYREAKKPEGSLIS